MVDAAEVVTIFARDYGELVGRMSGIGIYLGSEVIVSLGWAPVALLVLLNKFGFAVAGEIAELDERLVAREEDLGLEGGGDALA